MLGRELIPNSAWEHFPLAEVTDLAGILVDASISKAGIDKVLLTNVVYDPVTSEFSIDLLNGANSVSFTETGIVFGDYLVVEYTSPTGSLKLHLVFLTSSLPSVVTQYDLSPGVEFTLGAITYIDSKVTKIDSLDGIIDINAISGIHAEVSEGALVISLDEEIPCPEVCPPVELFVGSINGSFSNKPHVTLEGATHTIIPDYSSHPLTVINNLTPCCDCEDQAPIWNAFVAEVAIYNELVDELEALEASYLEVRDLLTNMSTEPCDIWKKIRDLHFPASLFCRGT